MKTLKYLFMAGALLLGASNSVAQKIPEFQRNYAADTKIPLVSAKGPILWEGKTYEVHNSPAHAIHELRGYINLPIKIVGIDGYSFRLGAITRIDGTTIESIIYTNTRKHETLSDYDKMIAMREGIKIDGLCSLWHEKYNFSDSTITNLETGEVRPMNGAREFQDLYFDIPKNQDLDTLVNIHFCGRDYPINIKVRANVIEADLTYPDTKNPGKRKELIEGILSMSVQTDKYGLPEKMIAGARMIIDFHPEAVYDPKIVWEDLR
jgi:hypothetical protein